MSGDASGLTGSVLIGSGTSSLDTAGSVQILGGGTTSRLYRSLVVEQGLAVSSGAGYSPDGLGPQTFMVYASPRDGTYLVRLEAAV